MLRYHSLLQSSIVLTTEMMLCGLMGLQVVWLEYCWSTGNNEPSSISQMDFSDDARQLSPTLQTERRYVYVGVRCVR